MSESLFGVIEDFEKSNGQLLQNDEKVFNSHEFDGSLIKGLQIHFYEPKLLKAKSISMSIAFYVVQLKTTFEALTHGHNYKNAISSRPFNKKKTFRFQASKNLSQVTALFPKVTEKIRFAFFLTEIFHSILFFSFSTLPYQRINATVFLFFFPKRIFSGFASLQADIVGGP